jgi:hypothetical protein
MQQKMLLKLICLCIGILFLVQTVPAIGIQEKVVIYSTDFSSNPGWITNNPSRYYWTDGSYHYETEGGTNGYSFIPIEYDNGDLVLEYDITPIKTSKDGAFRFGITSNEMDISRGTNVLSIFENGKYGKLIELRVIDQNNHIHSASSYYSSYCGSQKDCETKQFEDNTTYHVVMRYNDGLQNADLKVTNKETGEFVWGYFVQIGQDLHFLKRLAITTKGDYVTGNYAEGYLDNVELYTYKIVEQTPLTTVPTTPPATIPTTAPPTTVPTTQAPTGVPVICSSLIIAGIVVLMVQGHKRN